MHHLFNAMNRNNPYRQFNRYRYAWNLVPEGIENLLDYGCSNGKFTNSLKFKVKNLFGIDVDEEAIYEAKELYPYINFSPIKINSNKTDFPDNFFDVVTILDVIEHVPDEKETLKEIHRILKPGGLIILSAPHKGIFTFCDVGNIKFRFPKLHKFIYFHLLKQEDYYLKRFNNRSRGLIGDISISKYMFHKHYTLKELLLLMGPEFSIIGCKRFGLFHRCIGVIHFVYRWILGKPNKFLEKIDSIDQSLSFGWAADNIILVASCKKK